MSDPKVLFILLACFAAACERGSPDAGAQKPAPAAASERAAAMAESMADVQASVVRALGEYETIRGLLAKDERAGIAAAAGALAAATEKAAPKAPAAQRPQLEAMTRAARALEDQAASDIEEMRRAFGELSRPVVALLATDGELRKGRYVFECPMAQGYKKWVQVSESIENPYMGTKMLGCGGKSDWKA